MADKYRFKNAIMRTPQGEVCTVNGDKVVDHHPQPITEGSSIVYPANAEPVTDPVAIRKILAGEHISIPVPPEAVVTRASLDEAVRNGKATRLP